MNSLMFFAVAGSTVGNISKMLIKVTHATAIAPIGTNHLPRVKLPGTNVSRPDVIRRKMGAAYDV
jgi:hypothetical protein